MSHEEMENPCKQRFKGIEHFLRRIAFNLGNTPSQTEVKIISCIPIDVTDLQQKILSLENELCAARQNKTKQCARTVDCAFQQIVHNKQIRKQISNVATEQEAPPPSSLHSKKKFTHDCDCSIPNKSNVSFKPAVYHQEDVCASLECVYSKFDKAKFLTNDRIKNLFKKRKKTKTIQENGRGETQLIYFAQTRNNANNCRKPLHDRPSTNIMHPTLSSSYLSHVFRKHHDPSLVIDEYSDTSQFSQPICRDIKNKSPPSVQSDICSCCHGRCQNIDKYMKDTSIKYLPIICSKKKRENIPHFVDVIPVKEVSNAMKNGEFRTPKWDGNKECWPDKIGKKNRCRPYIVNYEMNIPIKGELPTKHNTKHVHKKVKLKKSDVKVNQETCVENSKSCCIDCGDTYVKTPKTFLNPDSPLLKNQSVGYNETYLECKNDQRIPLHNAVDCTKTEVTLREIKNILQSVLAQVKTNGTNKDISNGANKNDAIVQKGTSHNKIHVGSSTLDSNNIYNTSYNTNPCLVSCSRQIAAGPYCYSSIPYEPLKYMQNYPFFIQTNPGRHICTCYHKSKSYKISQAKHSIDISTNTEKELHVAESKETEKLIKEIYKSVTLNMGYPSKDNSSSGFDDVRSTLLEYNISGGNNKYDDTITEVSKVKKDIEVEALLTPFMSYTTDSKLVYTAASSQSRYRKKSTEYGSSTTEAPHVKMNQKYKINNDVIGEDDIPISDAESYRPRILDLKNTKVKNQKKQGLLSNMFKSVKLFKKKEEKTRNQETAAISDSDEYETVYSEKPEKNARNTKKRATGISYTFQPTTSNKKRNPRMEYEYRKHWDDNLILSENKTSKNNSTPWNKYNSQPVYWRNYEARSAFVEPLYVPNSVLSTVRRETGKKAAKTKFIGARHKLAWLKKHKRKCGVRWKKFILEN